MAQHAFYGPNFSVESPQLEADEEFHCQKVLRVRRGEEIIVLNGQGIRYTCAVQEKGNHMSLKVRDIRKASPTPRIHLIVAPPKEPARIDWLVEKSAELGVRQLSFMITKRSTATNIRNQRLERIAISALKQSQQPYLLKIDPPLSMQVLMQKYRIGQHFIALLEATKPLPLRTDLKWKRVFIGPPGGFTEEEKTWAKTLGYEAFSMGSGTLRTETAAIVAGGILLNDQHT